METLGDAIPKEQARCRDLLIQYKQLGTAGGYGVLIIEGLLQAMDKAVIENDLPKMIELYQEMRGLR